jgi:hypothetical protein
VSSLGDQKFIILVDRATDDELNAAHEQIKKKAGGWWHRYTNTWIVGGLTEKAWRDLVRPVLTGISSSVLVMKLPDAGDRRWAYYGENVEERMRWLHRNYTN